MIQQLEHVELEEEAFLFKMVGDPVRLQILHLLAEQPGLLCVLEIEREIGRLKQASISHHLGLLYNAGLLDRQKRGQSIYYQLKPAVLTRMIALLEGLRQ